MRVEQIKNNKGRVVLSNMITSTAVLSRVASRWEDPGLFASAEENLIASWCVDYHRKHGRAPRKAIRSLYDDWQEGSQDRDAVRLVDKLLRHVSADIDERGKLSADHVLDLAGSHFHRVRAERLKDQLEAHLEAGHLKKIDAAVANFRRVELGEGSYVEVMQDDAALADAFKSETLEQLIEFGNPLDKFFIHMLHRKSFVAFQAAEKAGKSFWLTELAYLAACQRRRVAFFAIGDLTQAEMMLRFASRATGEPNRGPFPMKLRIPKAIEKPAWDAEEKLPKVRYARKEFADGLSYKKARAKFDEVGLKKIKSKRPHIRMSCHDADSINVLQIRQKLKEWQSQGFVADVVIIDYADILAPLPGYWKDEREYTNASWKKLKAMAQELHCLLITATQADAASYTRRSQTRRNFNADKRKYAHVDGMVAINSTEEEKELGVCRLAWLAARHNRYSALHECYVAGNLAVASPAIVAAF